MTPDECKGKEEQLVAELANRVLEVTADWRLQWRENNATELAVDLKGGSAKLVARRFSCGRYAYYFSVFDLEDTWVGEVSSGHDALRYNLQDAFALIYRGIIEAKAGHQATVALISGMLGGIDELAGDDAQSEMTLPSPEEEEVDDDLDPEVSAEEEDVDEINPEDEEYVFEGDMQAQAKEFAGGELFDVEEEPISLVPGRKPAPQPAQAPEPPTVIKKNPVRRKVRRKKPKGSRVLDQDAENS